MKLTDRPISNPISLDVKSAFDQRWSLTGKDIYNFATQITRGLFKSLAGGNQLEIWQSRDRQGNLLWNVRDRLSGRSAQLDSEQEVRIWLEERYHH
ncbi:hypothetical protein [Lyngbya sp. CCY1209]|jgi:hypothetical protein|uniref:hypothetical protein n=1 Tax=Lyngbya sp. CCY1209 TaxID=2886103 RepID=UPI002D20B966|nr:hypothetical protein [Lyngbya sp. CCY1209]MEB3882384.1 hypothetical protein [Lyngbya sp. CCY1209]